MEPHQRTKEEYEDCLAHRGQFKDLNGKWYTPSYILTDSPPPIRGANVDCTILDDNTFRKDGFLRRLGEVLQKKWNSEQGGTMKDVLIFISLPVSIPLLLLATILVGSALGLHSIYKFLRFWTWDILKEAFKNE